MDFKENESFYEHTSTNGVKLKLISRKGNRWKGIYEKDFLIFLEFSKEKQLGKCPYCGGSFEFFDKLEYPYRIDDQLIMLDAVLSVIVKKEELKKRIDQFEKVLDQYKLQIMNEVRE